MNYSGKTKLKRNEKVLSGGIENEMVLLDLDHNNYIVLNSVGRRIWELIDQIVQIDDLCAILQSEFEVDDEVCRNNTIDFIKVLDKKRMIIFDE